MSKRIALYGKGGIGKSTIAANLTAALAGAGNKVLQIGCDPKHDSTRLLLNGEPVVTVLDYLRDTAPEMQRLDDILHTGYLGVKCVEAGGPEPGVGCAGRGILSTFELLDRLGLREKEFDIILYDVLGDVVCGGFAVPLRRGYADVIYVVTSEEFMSIYAANNILRGVKNFDGNGPRLAGLILNSRGADEDRKPVFGFAEAVRLPVDFIIPRSDCFRRAEEEEKTIIEAFPESGEAEIFFSMAKDIIAGGSFFPALPVEDDELGRITKKNNKRLRLRCPVNHDSVSCKTENNLTVSPIQDNPEELLTSNYLSKSILCREPLHGCAFTGAVCTTTQIKNTITIAHGPHSCSHIAMQTIFSSGLHALYTRGAEVPELLAPLMTSTGMNENVVIFGGIDKLVEEIKKALRYKPGAVFVVTTCPAGVIGDDVQRAVRDASAEISSVPVISITSDGNMAGDYAQGVINACIEGAASLIDNRCVPEGDLVNIIAEKNIAANAETNFETVSALLRELNVGVNCRFIRRTSVDDLRGFLKAGLNILAYNDHFSRVLQKFLKSRFDARFAENPFPVGFHETEQWFMELAGFFDKKDRAETIIDSYRHKYMEKIKRLQPLLKGKRLMIISYIHNIDWILETAFDLGMDVVKVCILNYSQDNIFRTRYNGRFEYETDYSPDKRHNDFMRLNPHIVLCNYAPGDLPIDAHVDTIPMCPDTGFFGGLKFAVRWAALIKSPVREGWRDDVGLL